jgi:hypothetical protein
VLMHNPRGPASRVALLLVVRSGSGHSRRAEARAAAPTVRGVPAYGARAGP